MKNVLTLLAVSPALALAHGNHQDIHSDLLHSLMHAALSLEGFVALAALGVAVYFVWIKQ